MVAAVLVRPASLGLAVPGDTATFQVLVHDAQGYPIRGRSVTWTSASPDVVRVDADGRVNALALGQVVISASVEGVVGTADVEVDPSHSVARNCGGCHVTLSGEHASLLLPLGSCWSCHALATEGHEPTQRNHVAASGGFVLLGIHDSVACGACHSDGHDDAQPLPADPEDCVACHREVYERRHGGEGYPTACGTCHTPTLWEDVTFDHGDASGGFALRWAHDSLACTACHMPESFTPRFSPEGDEDCVACHRTLYDQVHGASGYPTSCLSCHGPDAWTDLTYAHRPESGGFPLLGVHATLSCSACHAETTFTPLYAPAGAGDCVACHRADYDAVHGGSTFPTTCAACHTTTTWVGAVVDHGAVSGGFELWGVHAALACTACHEPGTFEARYAPADDQDCVACHRDDYDDAHADSGYPVTCLVCHDGVTWPGAVFDHDAQYFPIYTGEHRNRWVSDGCPTCHNVSSDFGIFTCLACHRHDEDLTDQDHMGVEGYVYDSKACLSCHPDGTA